MIKVDINADVGVGFEGENSSHDEKIIKRLTSANIACGFQGGDPAVMARSVDFACKYRVAIGASLGLPGMMGLGLEIQKISPKKTYAQTLYQIGALQAFAQAKNQKVVHAKPSGALYEAAHTDYDLARAIADAVAALDAGIMLIGLEGSQLLAAGRDAGLAVRAEMLVKDASQVESGIPDGIDSLAVDSEDGYAVMLLDQIRRTLHKEGIEPSALS